MIHQLPDKLRDLQFKELFSDPALIAFLATQVIDEYKGKAPPPVKAIQRLDTELHIAGHGFSRPDLVWHLPRPDMKHRCILSIDLQNNSTPGYALSRRIEYQGARLLVTQPGSILPVKLDYNLLEPVYELFIKPFPTLEERLTVRRVPPLVSIHRPFGNTDVLEEGKDRLVHPTSICLNGNKRVDWKRIPKGDLLRSIGILADPFLDVTQAARLLEQDYGFTLNDYTKEVKHAMYTMYDWMKDAENASRMEGRDEGIALGRSQGRSEGRNEGRGEGRAEERAAFISRMRARHIDESIIQGIVGDLPKLN